MQSDTFGTLAISSGPEAGKSYALTDQRNVIGREEHVQVQILAAGVSREHAVIFFSDKKAYLEDLNSSNGTFLNGERIQQPETLRDGDKIGLGRNVVLEYVAPEITPGGLTSLEMPVMAGDHTVLDPNQTVLDPALDLESEATVISPSELVEKPTQLPARVIVQIGSEEPQAYELDKPVISVGRAHDNDIVVSRPFMSRYHLRLTWEDGRHRLRILSDTSNPIYIEGSRVTGSRLLEDGDVLRIGIARPADTVKLRYEAPDAPPEASRPAGASTAPTQAISLAPQARSTPPKHAPSGTLLYDSEAMEALAIPPRLLVTVAGDPVQSFFLVEERYRIGRAEDNDIVINSPIVSRYHATLVREDPGYRIEQSAEAGNPINHEGRPLTGQQKLRHEDILRIGGTDPGVMVTMNYLSPSQLETEIQPIEMPDKGHLSVGRSPENDIVLDAPIVSHFHAHIEKVGQRFRVRDLRSSNGTFVNNERIEGEVWLRADDEIRIGNHRFIVGDNQLSQLDESSGLHVVATGLQKWVRKDLNILQNISLNFQPREFVVVVGQSGGGKSTLVDAIAGYRPATHGNVTVNGIDVYKNFDAIRNDIGFVPQRDIIHMELSVFEALDYTARLRMPPETTKEERHKRVMEVLEDLDLAHRQDVPVSGLSGGQQKRVSIGVELITKPGLFFLDEPTSGLDPGTETSLMQLMRRLADQGRTIVLITHATKNVMLADKVVFLARGGYLCWFGPPDEALAYFDQYRTDRERRANDIEFDELYAILEDTSRGTPEEWGRRFREHPAYAEYIGRPEQTPPQPAVKEPARRRSRKVGALRQFLILSSRNIKILTRDRFSLFLMLAAAPLVSLLDVVLAWALGSDPFDFVNGSLPDVMITLFLPTVYGVMVGGISQMREIVKEQDIYKRERLVNLKVLPYILSKIWVAGLLALYQTAAYVIVHYLAFDMPGGVLEFVLIYISLALATMAGMMLGLFSSALAPTPNAAPLIIILFMLPQIVLSGALLPLPTTVTAPISTRWAFEAFMAITGTGADVAADPCWLVPAEQRSLLTLDYKAENCRCMGVNVVNEASCSFPGVGKFYSAAIDAPPPQEPPPLRGEPAEPDVPPQPIKPEDESDQIALAEYLDALQLWQDEVEVIQNAYEQEVDVYRAEAEIYQAEVVSYRTALADWQIDRAKAIEPAEGLIDQFYDAFGWAFKSREDTQAYYQAIANTWIAQGTIIMVLFFGILILQKRKDLI